jgi:hypothetical protein
MKYTVEMTSDDMTYIPSIMKISIAVHKLKGEIYIQGDRQKDRQIDTRTHTHIYIH